MEHLRGISTCSKENSLTFILINPLSANSTKRSNTQTIRRQFADELFECVGAFCGIGA